jgi:hypothetical protein
MYQSLVLTLKRGKKGFTLLSSVNRGLVFVTKPSRKQNLFFQNKFIFFELLLSVCEDRGCVEDGGVYVVWIR